MRLEIEQLMMQSKSSAAYFEFCKQSLAAFRAKESVLSDSSETCLRSIPVILDRSNGVWILSRETMSAVVSVLSGKYNPRLSKRTVMLFPWRKGKEKEK